MRFLIFALITISVLIATPTAESCSCSGLEPEDCLQDASAVFTGRVESMQIRTHLLFKGVNPTRRAITQYPVFTLTVEKIYKGLLGDHVRIATGIGTADGTAGSDCSFPFEIGHEYLVYARSGMADFGGLLSTDVCGCSGPIAGAESFLGGTAMNLRHLEGKPPREVDCLSLEEANRWSLLRATSQISGKIWNLAESRKDFRLWRLIDGEWMHRSSWPDMEPDGSYTFSQLEPGDYRIGIFQNLGNGLKKIGFYGGSERLEETLNIQVRPKEKVSGIDIQLRPQSRHMIRGAIECPDGEAFRGKIKIRVANSWDRNRKIGAEINSCGKFQIPDAYSGKFRVIATLEPEALDTLDVWTISVPEIIVPEQASDVVLTLERERL